MALEKYFEQLNIDKKRFANILKIRGVNIDENETYSTLVEKTKQITGTKLAPEFITFRDNTNEKLDDELRCISFDNITSFSSMFSDCINLTSINMSLFPNTSNVTNMASMFSGCNNLSNLDLTSFDTSNVTNMHSMFNRCKKLTTLDLSSFNTSNVTDMGFMFNYNDNIQNINTSSFNTSKVTNFRQMFNGCKNLTTLDLTNFDTSNVTDTRHMFGFCSQLTSIDLSTWYAPNIEDVSYMFYGCSALKTLDVRSFDFTKIKSGHYDGIFNDVYIYCKIIVKDTANKEWVLARKSNLKNVKTVDEL